MLQSVKGYEKGKNDGKFIIKFYVEYQKNKVLVKKITKIRRGEMYVRKYTYIRIFR